MMPWCEKGIWKEKTLITAYLASDRVADTWFFYDCFTTEYFGIFLHVLCCFKL